MQELEVLIGWDPREQLAWNVCQRSIVAQAHAAGMPPPPIRPIAISTLGGLYGRPVARNGGQLIDTISGAPMSTEFSLARFWTPVVSRARWALFVDGDFMFRTNVWTLLEHADPRYAVQVVKHNHQPAERTKMDGQAQTTYPRKNWSSLILWNLAHAATRRLWLYDLNSRPGLWLHGFNWLQDPEIGELPAGWNHLECVSDLMADAEPKAVHYTLGTPDMPEAPRGPFLEAWLAHLTAAERSTITALPDPNGDD